MATVRSGFLCQALLSHDNGTLSSVLGMGTRHFLVPQLPAVVQFTACAVVEWQEAESGQVHVFTNRVLGPSGEVAARIDLDGQAPPWTGDSLLMPTTTVSNGFAFDARQPGHHFVALDVDGSELLRIAFKVESQMPVF